ncbi:LacI family DNA-binding transcriptional regulator [Nonomuraea sp. NPDC046570]|uniref:LacI family DNA-binding transcriptional regulator n=1 Tax=Nonomuraea sp. NPDC046570 TaxID=3155255 RepID=UPI00340DEF9F
MASKVSLSDVAAAAGVSISTASRALSGAGRVSAATRAHVLATAERLQFQPDVLARSFVTGKSFIVGILAENAPGLFSMPLVIGANDFLGRQGIASLTLDGHETPQVLVEHLKRLKARRVDGLLVIGDNPDLANVAWAIDFPAPVVYAFSVPGPGKDILVLPDNQAAGAMAGEHLVRLGRRHIAHITADRAFPAVEQRWAGLLGVLERERLRPVLGGPLHGDYKRHWGAEAARRLLDSGEPMDAIFAANDEIALGAYAVLAQAGLRIPDDVAIVGYDNWRGLTSRWERLLTTIDPCLVEVGQVAAARLLEAVAGEGEHGVHRVPCTLIEGRTTLGPTFGPYEMLL